MQITYEKIVTPYGEAIIKTEGDKVSIVPIDPANSDYQRYLNPEASQPIGGNK